jgi:hypothetical protein
MSLERQPWSDSLESVVHGKGFYDQFDCDYWKNKYRGCFGGDGGGGGGGGEGSGGVGDSGVTGGANDGSGGPGSAGPGDEGDSGVAGGFNSSGFDGVSGLDGIDVDGLSTDVPNSIDFGPEEEETGFFSALANTLTDPVGILSLALGVPGIVGFGISKGLEAAGLGIPSLANMAGVTENSTGLADLGLNAAQNAATDLGITDAFSGLSTDLGVTDALDSVTSGIAGLGLSGPAQSGIDATGFSGNSVGTGIASFSGAPMGLSSLAPGTSLAVADTTNLNDVTPAWSPANFQRYSGVGGFTPQAGIGALAANSNLYKNYMENT